jgi:tRNA (guanine37-N1)-methyltransferase
MNFYILSLFPNVLSNYFSVSIIGRAQKQEIINIKEIDIRDYTQDNYKSVDDTPYGGGAGMVMKVEPIYKAVLDLKQKIIKKNKNKKTRIILFSAKGKAYSQKEVKRLSKYDNIILICGRYEGIDQRVAKYIADEEISLGPYILTGGELAAGVLIDSITRILPNVLGNIESLKKETFSKKGYFKYPQYTKPAVFENKSCIVSKTKKWKVPKILLSGNHEKIKEWREKRSEKI